MTPERNVLRHTWVVVLVAALVVSANAGAAPPTAEELYQEAVVRYSMAKFKDALRMLKRAVRRTKEPKLLGRIYLHLGLTNAVLGREEEAQKAFRLGLSNNPLLSLDPDRFKVRIVELFEKVRSGLRGELEVSADRDGARVLVDGKEVGQAPCQKHLAIGQHQVEARTADGRFGAVEQVVVAMDQKVRVTLTLTQLMARLTVRSTPPGAEVLLSGASLGKTPLEKAMVAAEAHELAVRLDGHREVTRQLRIEHDQEQVVELRLETLPPPAVKKVEPPPPAPKKEQEATVVRRRSRLKRPWAWVTAGVGAACIGVGAGLLASRRVNELVQDEPGGPVREVTDSAAPGAVLVGVGAAAAAVSAYLFIRSERSVQAALDLTGDRVAVSVAGRF